MRITSSQHLPATPHEVAELFADPEFINYRGAASSTRIDDAVVTGSADGEFTVTTRRSVPADQIPPQMRAFVGSRLEIRQVEAWEPETERGRTANIVFEITGTPVRMTGTAHLEPHPDGGTTMTYDGDLRASVPLFASAVEDAAAKAVRTALEHEAAAARTWLTDRKTK